MSKILVVEDELLIASYLQDLLSAEGYEVVGIARDRRGATRLFRQTAPDLVLMDIHLRDGDDGIEAAETLRSLTPFILLYLTAHGEREVFERARDTHPQGFLVKPVNDRTVITTIETALANHAPDAGHSPETPPPSAPITYRDLSLDRSAGLLSVAGETVRLTPRESTLVALLLREGGRTVPLAQLHAAVWPSRVVSDNSLKTLVWRLRRKLPDPGRIRSVPRFGYVIE